MLYDTHVHTKFSHDSQMDLQKALQEARRLNLGLIVTEHLDLNYPDPLAFNLDVEGYFREYGPYRNDALLLGIEIGMGPDEVSQNRQLIEKYNFDYVLGSIHVIDQLDIYDEVFYTGRTKEAVFQQYFAAMLVCVQSYDCIDSLGHIDYIARYARFADAELYYAEFKEQIDQVLITLVQNGICLELNTRRLGNADVKKHLLPIYQRFYELGGRWITIGSDAHRAADIGKYFSTALEMAETCNLKPVWFKERRMQYL